VPIHHSGSAALRCGIWNCQVVSSLHRVVGEQVQEAFAAAIPSDADAGLVAKAVVDVVNKEFGKRPFRAHIDPTEDGAKMGVEQAAREFLS
jgi:hypothetical protein